MTRTVALALLLLAGCGKAPDPMPPDPVGRFQMLPGPRGGVYVLDTQNSGWVRYCVQIAEGAGVSCSAAQAAGA